MDGLGWNTQASIMADFQAQDYTSFDNVGFAGTGLLLGSFLIPSPFFITTTLEGVKRCFSFFELF
jgi:hypothetical protein